MKEFLNVAVDRKIKGLKDRKKSTLPRLTWQLRDYILLAFI
jgi:hypothetical protein